MRFLTIAVVLTLVVPMVAAQDEEQSQDDRYIQWTVDRLKSSLELTDEQVDEITKILQKAVEDRDNAVRDTLTEDQQEKFKGVTAALSGRSNRNRGGNNRSRNRNPFGALGAMDPSRLKESLDLTDEQVEKITPIVEEVQTEMQERMAELRENGFRGLDWQEEMKKFRERMDKLGTDIKEHLTDEQKKKFDETYGQNNEGGTPTPGGDNNRGRNRGRSMEDRIKRVLDRINVEDEEEKDAIGELIKAVLEALDEVRAYGRESRDKIREASRDEDLDDDAIQEVLEEVRTKRSELNKKLRSARNDLREVVSYRQELLLIELGVIE